MFRFIQKACLLLLLFSPVQHEGRSTRLEAPARQISEFLDLAAVLAVIGGAGVDACIRTYHEGGEAATFEEIREPGGLMHVIGTEFVPFWFTTLTFGICGSKKSSFKEFRNKTKYYFRGMKCGAACLAISFAIKILILSDTQNPLDAILRLRPEVFDRTHSPQSTPQKEQSKGHTLLPPAPF